ncbi:hypothetical protein [Paenibacillus cisolokensis]|uniref:hypothetical protein n=1 Tax=Paenibacillus cisolokensis TaxID=1658519 RepID=UPI001FCF9337|nr:hypothetical protein [Paenibacillus cisolokensis]
MPLVQKLLHVRLADQKDRHMVDILDHEAQVCGHLAERIDAGAHRISFRDARGRRERKDTQRQ